MKVHLSVDSEDEPSPLSDSFTSCVNEVLEKEIDEIWPQDIKKPKAVEMSLIFLSSEGMKEQNASFRDIDEPTDVLSFPLWEEDGRFVPNDNFPILPLGDVLICMEKVAENARENRVELNDELCLVIAHGFLHLFAWDHQTEEDRAEMWIRQDKIKASIARCPSC